MSIFPPLVLLAAGFMILTPAMAQVADWDSWSYQERTDPFTDEVIEVYAIALRQDEGALSVNCEDGNLIIGASFEDGDVELIRPAHILWRVNDGKLVEFTLETSLAAGYVVGPPESIELARSLIQARQFATSNGADEILQFDNLLGSENVERVLKACEN